MVCFYHRAYCLRLSPTNASAVPLVCLQTSAPGWAKHTIRSYCWRWVRQFTRLWCGTDSLPASAQAYQLYCRWFSLVYTSGGSSCENRSVCVRQTGHAGSNSLQLRSLISVHCGRIIGGCADSRGCGALLMCCLQDTFSCLVSSWAGSHDWGVLPVKAGLSVGTDRASRQPPTSDSVFIQ